MAVADLLSSFLQHAPVADLDLSLIDDILKLPCIIDESKPLLTYPIYSHAIYRGNGIYEHLIYPNESLSNFLERIYNPDGYTKEHEMFYPMDCGAFAQLASLVLGHLFHNTIKLYVPNNAMGTILLWTQKLKQMVYIRIIDTEMNKYLQTLATAAKGQWVIQLDEDMYLGLLDEGPTILRIHEWVQKLHQGLQQYNLNVKDPQLTLYLDTHQLNLWGVYTDGLNPIEIFQLI